MQLQIIFLNGCGTAPGNLVYVMHHEPETVRYSFSNWYHHLNDHQNYQGLS